MAWVCLSVCLFLSEFVYFKELIAPGSDDLGFVHPVTSARGQQVRTVVAGVRRIFNNVRGPAEAARDGQVFKREHWDAPLFRSGIKCCATIYCLVGIKPPADRRTATDKLQVYPRAQP